MNLGEFKVGFWHYMGAHSGESRDAILRRKALEAAEHGWTLWTFSHKKDGTLEAWSKELARAKFSPVLAFCSDSPRAADPAKSSGADVVTCGWCRPLGSEVWFPIPKGIKARHALKDGQDATAFVVRRVHDSVVPVLPFNTSWLAVGKGGWRKDGLPTRGEYLIRRGGKVQPGAVYAMLELVPPYVVQVRP